MKSRLGWLLADNTPERRRIQDAAFVFLYNFLTERNPFSRIRGRHPGVKMVAECVNELMPCIISCLDRILDGAYAHVSSTA